MVLRVSGQKTKEAAEALAGPLPAPRRAGYRAFRDGDEVLDAGLLLWFPGPKSYTGEDMAELQLHGSPAILARFSRVFGMLGVRLAEPGEFTRRAVLNGKMDLTAAEAVADIVNAETEAQRKQALRQLGGELRALYDDWRQKLTRAQAHLEAAIDFADDDLPERLREDVADQLRGLMSEMKTHLSDNHRGERLREGLYAAIIGAPNAGKSSLLNRLARREVAIVTPLPGTTRDVLEVQCDVGGYPLTLADTAGLREAADVVEQEGVRRALQRAEQADFRVLVFDAAAEPDAATLAQQREGDVVVWNKSDLATCGREGVSVSAMTGDGLEVLLAALAQKAEALVGLGLSPSLTRERHRLAVEESMASLTRALGARQLDLMAEDVRLASRSLGRITGQVGAEDLLDVIFRDFCLGK
jgi:tRNA modification GTPase